MRLSRTPRFDEEAERFDLQFCCEECGHFDARARECAHFWPTELHREAYYQVATPEIIFCKEFELC